MKELESFFTRLPKGLKQEFVNKADEEGYKVQSLVAKLMKEWIEQQEKGGK